MKSLLKVKRFMVPILLIVLMLFTDRTLAQNTFSFGAGMEYVLVSIPKSWAKNAYVGKETKSDLTKNYTSSLGVHAFLSYKDKYNLNVAYTAFTQIANYENGWSPPAGFIHKRQISVLDILVGYDFANLIFKSPDMKRRFDLWGQVGTSYLDQHRFAEDQQYYRSPEGNSSILEGVSLKRQFRPVGQVSFHCRLFGYLYALQSVNYRYFQKDWQPWSIDTGFMFKF